MGCIIIPTIHYTTFHFRALIEVECELCNKYFNYESSQKTKISGAWKSDVSNQVQKMRRDILNRLKSSEFIDIKIKRCPQCDYIQSWMVKRAKRDLGFMIGLMGLVLFVVGALMIKLIRFKDLIEAIFELIFTRDVLWLVIGLLIIPRIIMLIVQQYYNPNKKILNGREVPARKMPRVQIKTMGMPSQIF